MDDAVFHRPDRDVLLHGGVGGAGNDLAHRLAAADDRDAYVLNFGNQRKELHPGEKPEVCFALCEGDEVEAVYAYCNLHSLWKA